MNTINNTLDNRNWIAGLKPNTVGFACAVGFFLSTLSLVLHWYELKSPAAASAARIVGAFCLFCAPLFPWLALASPEPVNGVKLLVFPAATMLALTPWIPNPWLVNYGYNKLVSGILMFSIVGNLLAPWIPIGTRSNSLYKTIRWGSGGRLMFMVALLGFCAAFMDANLTRRGGASAYRFASVVLLVTFAFFIQTRFTTSPRAMLAGLAVGMTAWVLTVGSSGDDSDDKIAGLALAVGSLYCSFHVAQGATAVWTLLAIFLTAGALRDTPSLATGLIPGLVMLTVPALMTRRWAGAVFMVLVAAIGAAVALSTREPEWLDTLVSLRDARFIGVERPAFLILIALAMLALVKMRFPAGAVVLFVVACGWFIGAHWSRTTSEVQGLAWPLGFSLLTGGILARRVDAVLWREDTRASVE